MAARDQDQGLTDEELDEIRHEDAEMSEEESMLQLEEQAKKHKRRGDLTQSA